MKKLVLFFLLFSGALYGQQNNTTNTNFTNGLGASKFFNIPRGTTPPATGVLAGSLFYHTTLGLQYYDGSVWKTVGLSGSGVTSFNGRTGAVVPLTGDYSSFYATITGSNIDLTDFRTALNVNNTDNTSDANKPVSTATQAALDGKQATLISGTNIKTINGETVLGSGNVVTTTASNTQTFTNKSGAISQWTNDVGYLTSASGVTSLAGTANEIEVSASTGAVTLSLPGTINANTTGNAATVTNGLYTTGNQTGITGNKIWGTETTSTEYLKLGVANITLNSAQNDKVLIESTGISFTDDSAPTFSVKIGAAPFLSANRTIGLPNKDGTFAVTSDLHNPVTIGTANGLSLSTQVLSLGLASTSTTGALSSTDWNTFNSKQPAGNYLPLEAGQFNKLTGGLYMNNNLYIYVRNAANTDNLRLFGLSDTDQLWLDPDGIGVNFGWSGAFTGPVTAASFTGAGTGLTGTASALNIGGNAATATSFGGWTGNFAGLGSAPEYFVGAEGGVVRAYSAAQYQTALGITGGPFLPVANPTFTGTLTGPNALFNGGGDALTLSKSNNLPTIRFNGAGSGSLIEGGDTFNIYTGGSVGYTMDASRNNTWTGYGTFGGAVTSTVANNTNAFSANNANGRIIQIPWLTSVSGSYIGAQNLAGTVNQDLYLDGTNIKLLAPLTGTTATFSSTVFLANNQVLAGRNAANNADKELIKISTSDKVTIDGDGLGTVLGGTLTGTSATFNPGTGTTLTGNILTVKGGGSIGDFGFSVQANNGDNILSTNHITYATTLGGALIGTSATFGGNLATSGILKLGAVNGAFHSAGVNYFYSGGTSAVITNSTGTTDLVTVLEGGNVLIGTTTDNGSKLNVNGTVTVADATASTHAVNKGQLDLKATGAASSTDNAIARFDGATGNIIQNSNIIVDDNGSLAWKGGASATTGTLSSTMFSSNYYGSIQLANTANGHTASLVANLGLTASRTYYTPNASGTLALIENISTAKYKVYTAVISQNSTNAPVVDWSLDNSIGSIVWSRTGTGIYKATLTGAFTSNKVWISLTNGTGSASRFEAYRNNADEIVITSSLDGVLTDSRVSLANIEIRVYD